jgi:hypothetical protein
VLVAADADIDPRVRTARLDYEAFALRRAAPASRPLSRHGAGGAPGPAWAGRSASAATCPDGVRGLLAGTTVDLTAALRDARGQNPAEVEALRGYAALTAVDSAARRRRAGDDRA